MYSATCPRCGTTLYSTVRGQAWLACQTCKYFGLLLTTPLPTSTALSQAPAHTSAPTATPSPTTTLAESLLGALQQNAQLYGEEIAAQLATFTPHDYRLSLTQVWDRMQQATDTLFRSLGERRMGDYPPDIESVSRALGQIGAWHVIALQVAGRLHEPGERHD
ncbi:MAG TPA: hypothetical protein VFQ25_01495 [Ktedonobacterales bacterium]|nr:hypothetical protein [Ktedonobacterales bacterium]